MNVLSSFGMHMFQVAKYIKRDIEPKPKKNDERKTPSEEVDTADPGLNIKDENSSRQIYLI